MTQLPTTNSDAWTVQFRAEREAQWRKMERILATAERDGLANLTTDQLVELPGLHRGLLSSLGVARAGCLDRSLLDYLESLAARAHLCLYAPRESFSSFLAHQIQVAFPAAVRELRWSLLAAALAVLLGGLIAFSLCSRDLDLYDYFVDAARSCGRDPEASTEALRETLFAGTHDGADRLLHFACWLWQHNSRVTLLAFGLCILGGLPGLLLLLITGFELGAMTALFHDRGLAVEWWSWILPHGVTELLAACIGAAAGLHMAAGFLFAARHSRLDNLLLRGRAAGPTVFGALLMLLLAGLIEGFFRQSVQQLSLRYTLAILTAALWVLYFRRSTAVANKPSAGEQP